MLQHYCCLRSSVMQTDQTVLLHAAAAVAAAAVAAAAVAAAEPLLKDIVQQKISQGRRHLSKFYFEQSNTAD
jgi:hypothetical protein